MERSTIDGKEISFLPNEGYDIYIPQSVSLFRRLSCKQLIPSSPGAHRLVVFKSTSGVLHLRKHFVQTEKTMSYCLHLMRRPAFNSSIRTKKHWGLHRPPRS